MTDYNTQGDGYRADCLGCNGTCAVRAFAGDEEILAPCEDCGGMGYQLTRDEFANLDALQGDRDLRLAPEPEDQPSFRNHAEEIEWHLSQHRRAS